VLFGDYNPAGRLPVTFYKSDSDLPDFNDYNMSNRTYRYFKGEALYPFGYGLSYSSFKYDALKIPGSSTAGKNITASVAVTNTGKIAGDEVVQLYVSDPVCSVMRPEKELKAFEKIFLQPGETRTVAMQVKVADLAFYDESKKAWNTEAGEYILNVGNSSRAIFQQVKISVK